MIHAGASHFDLRAAGDWSGASPSGKSVSHTPYNGSGSLGTGITLSAPVEGFTSIANSTQTLADQTMNSNTSIKKKALGGILTNAIGLTLGVQQAK